MGHEHGIWQAEVASRVDELNGRLAAVIGAASSGTSDEEEAIQGAVANSLQTAELAATDGGQWGRLKAWWTGSAITGAWEAVHHAELALVGIERKRDVQATLARLLAWVQAAIDDGARRKRHEEALNAQMKSKAKFDRVQIRRALTDVIAANRDRYANLRVFRNILILVTILLALLTVTVSVWHALNPDFLDLCPKGSEACPSGPPGSQVALIALLGAIGGSLSLALGLTEMDTTPSRYDPKAWQAFLKPITGAVTAILGVLFIQAEFLISPTGNLSLSLLVYAVLFGFSQQLFTRVVDKKAETLITPTAKST